jgi:hypothetical protein
MQFSVTRPLDTQEMGLPRRNRHLENEDVQSVAAVMSYRPSIFPFQELKKAQSFYSNSQRTDYDAVHIVMCHAPCPCADNNYGCPLPSCQPISISKLPVPVPSSYRERSTETRVSMAFSSPVIPRH